MNVKEKYCHDCTFDSLAGYEEPCVKCIRYGSKPHYQSRALIIPTTKENKDQQQQQHYITCGQTYQPILVMQAVFSKEELIGFLKGNILKYTCRMGKKEGEGREKEARKVQQYSEWLAVVTSGGQIEI